MTLERVDSLTQRELYAELDKLVARSAAGDYDGPTARTIADLHRHAQSRDGLTVHDAETLRGILRRVASRNGARHDDTPQPSGAAPKFGPAYAAAVFARREQVVRQMQRRVAEERGERA